MKTQKQKTKLATKHGRIYRDSLIKRGLKGISVFASPFWENRKKFIREKVDKTL